MDADLVKSALMCIARLKKSLAKGLKKNGDKSEVYYAENYTTNGLRISRNGAAEVYNDSAEELNSNILKPIRGVRFTEAVVRHANIRDPNRSLGMICPGDPHQRNPNAPKFEDRSQEETELQERCAREAAWRLAESIQKLKENKASILLTFGKLVPACAVKSQT